MHTRRLITFLLGIWFALVISMGVLASINTRVAQTIAKTPPGPPARALSVIGEPMTEQIFNYIAAEINRTLFEMIGTAELTVVFLLACLLFLNDYSRPAIILAGVLLLAAITAQFLLTPQLVMQGRLLDFRPEDMLLAERARFANVQQLHGVLTVFRLLCGSWIAGILLYRGPNSRMRRRVSKIDAVDNANDGHVDG